MPQSEVGPFRVALQRAEASASLHFF
uniref:Uncharacterized protein n=1 Tax=Arundo donax TaxID=35708 RepID=A0A0A9BP24_ARUDO